VPLSSAPVQLLNLSAAQLRRLLAQQGLSGSATATKKELIEQLVAGLTPEVDRHAGAAVSFCGSGRLLALFA
jgi:hypothetical protein